MDDEAMAGPQAYEDFQAAIASIQPAYSAVTIRYLAGRRTADGPWHLLQAHITLEPCLAPIAGRAFESARLRAGVFAATGAEFRPAPIIEALLRGEFPGEDGAAAFDARDGGAYDLYMMRSYPDVATNTENRIGLRISGNWVQNAVPLNELGWELMGSEPPFESLQELADAFGLGPVQTQNATVELWTTPVLYFTEETQIRGTEAQIAIWLAPALDPNEVRIGHKMRRVAESSGVFLGRATRWTRDGDGHRCVHRFVVAEHCELLCTLGYGKTVQGFAVLRDERPIANVRRRLYETVDSGLAKLVADLQRFKVAEQNSAAFELLIARLFWLAGFNPIHLGQDKKTERAADIIALTPEDDVLLIECTTGILKKDKRSQLLRRAQILRDALSQSPSGPCAVIPLMITCLPWLEAQADADQAQADGIGIYSYEDIMDLMAKNAAPTDPAATFAALRHRSEMAALVQQGEWPNFPSP
jgi:hypothetical protein